MNRPALPITVTPSPGESMLSLLLRAAAQYAVAPEALLAHCLGSTRAAGLSPDSLTCHTAPAVLAALSQALRIPEGQLIPLTLSASFPSAHEEAIAWTSAARDMTTREETPSGQLRGAWCPLCLMEDRAGGSDHALRLEWALGVVTFCPHHQRPLLERCQTCYHCVERPEAALYGDQVALVCPACATPLDAHFGFDYVSHAHAQHWMRDAEVQQAWHRLIGFERQVLEHLRQPEGQDPAREALAFHALLGLMDSVLHADAPNSLRPLDLYESPYFPAPPKLSGATRHLKHPYRAAHLVERRKALALLIGLLEGAPQAFGFDPAHTTLRAARELMFPGCYDAFERKLLSLARLSLPA